MTACYAGQSKTSDNKVSHFEKKTKHKKIKSMRRRLQGVSKK